MISIILRNRNEGDYIGFALQSICDFIPDAEVIVIDNNSTDDSLDIVKLFNNRLNITVVSIDNYTPGKSINKAVTMCTNDIILILSAHSQITKMDINYVFDKLSIHSAVFGNQTPIYRGKKINKRYIWSHFTDGDVINMWSEIENRPFLHNAFCFYNKKDLVHIPFDETLPSKEDRYWAINILNNKKSYLYTSNIEVNHYYTPAGATWKGLG
tara:strand:+ start:84 stop:719 length:636 start_codon:yes stop_codon:yes gene_type:complete